MTLEPCTAREFDIDVIRYASMPGWRSRIVEGERCEGYVDGRLVLKITRRGDYAEHFRVPREETPVRILPAGFRYK